MNKQKLYDYLNKKYGVCASNTEILKIIDITKDIIFEASNESLSVRENVAKGSFNHCHKPKHIQCNYVHKDVLACALRSCQWLK